jgi:hypothetical protein
MRGKTASAVAVWMAIVCSTAGFFACTAAEPKAPIPDSVAVWDLEYLGEAGGPHAGIGELLAAEIIQTISRSDRYAVIERQRLLLALEELNLGSSDLADSGTRLRVGRIVGARQMIFGTYMVLDEILQLDIRRVEVETGRILDASRQQAPAGDPAAWLEAARQAAAEVM